jgi:predicted DNA-binding protein (MmcQ/YjbR family)
MTAPVEEGRLDGSAASRLCASLPGAVAGYPFGPEALVYKAGGRMFALLAPGSPDRLSLKCDPVLAEALRAGHAAVLPGYHLNKRHWNTLLLDGSLPPALVADLVRHSWELVVGRLPRAERRRLLEAAPWR